MLKAWGEKPVTIVSPWDTWSRDFRIVPIFQTICLKQEVENPMVASCCFVEDICGELITLSNENNKTPVKILINGPGGSVIGGYMIIQTVEHLKKMGIEVWTVNFFATHSMAAIILMAGTPGRRYAIDGGVTHTHGGMQGVSGRPDDVEEMSKFQTRVRDWMYDFISQNSKIPEFRRAELEIGEQSSTESIELNPRARIKLIKDFLQIERFLTADETKMAGIVDDVLRPGDQRINQIFSSKFD